MIPEASLADISGQFAGKRVFVSESPADTLHFGEKLGLLLSPGSVIALRGSLGAGKTWFTKGIARALGVAEEVASATYTILSEYEGSLPPGEDRFSPGEDHFSPGEDRFSPGPLPFYHFDAWRLAGDGDFAALGGEEYLEGGGISVIEWSERIPGSIPETAITVEIAIAGENRRRITITAPALPGLENLA
jgi:tRNA threonylcarbamoyladenosine biosynthesis protein TsaE